MLLHFAPPPLTPTLCACLEAENNRYWEASTCIYKMFCTTFGYLIDVQLNQITIIEIVFNFLK